MIRQAEYQDSPNAALTETRPDGGKPSASSITSFPATPTLIKATDTQPNGWVLSVAELAGMILASADLGIWGVTSFARGRDRGRKQTAFVVYQPQVRDNRGVSLKATTCEII